MLLHFVDGEKGGVGKSWFCRLLVECCLIKVRRILFWSKAIRLTWMWVDTIRR
jgi:hypothetical protein